MITLLILLMTATMTSCGDNNNEQLWFNGGGGGSTWTTLESAHIGRVYLSRLAPGVTVNMLPVDSDLVLQSFTTDSGGQFLIPEGAVPTSFRLSAQAPEGVTVECHVNLAEQDEQIWLDIPSTIISAYKKNHPDVSLSEIESRLKTALGLRESQGLHGNSDHNVSPFSHAVFLRHAAARGGFEALVNKIAADLDNGVVSRFRDKHKFVSNAGSRGDTSTLAQVLGRGFLAEVGGFLLEETAGIIIDKVAEESVGEFGKLTGLSGLQFGKAAKYEAVIEALEEIVDAIGELSEAINKDYLDTLATVDKNQLNTYLISVGTAYQELIDLSKAFSSQITSTGEADIFDHGPGAIPDQRTSALAAYAAVVGDNAFSALNRFLTSSDPSVNILALFGRTITAEILPAGARNVTADYRFYPVRYDRYSEEMLENYQLYAGYVQQVAVLISEAANTSYLPQSVINAGVGEGYQPPSASLNEAYHDMTELADLLTRADNGFVSQPAGSNLVMIDAVNHKMWYLSALQCDYTTAQNTAPNLNIANWRYPSDYTKPGNFPRDADDLHGMHRPSNLKGWRVPESSELTQLRNLISQVNSGAPGDVNKTYEAMVKLGFTGLTDPKDDFYDACKKFWCNSFPPEDHGPGFTNWAYFDMTDGKKHTDSAGDAFGQPLIMVAFVRDIQHFDQYPNFGDTIEQIVRAYGESPDVLSAASEVDPDTHRVTFQIQGHMLNDYVTPADITDLVTFTVTDENGSSSNAPAFARYRILPGETQNIEGEEVDVGRTVIDLFFIRNSTAKITFHGLGKSLTWTGSPGSGGVPPRVTGIMISPQNLQLQGIPNSNSSYQYYCTGYLTTGETVDLTRVATWSVNAPSGTTPTVILNGTNGGLLEFGSEDSLSDSMTVSVTVNGQGSNFTTNGQAFSDQSTITVPVRN